MWRTSNGEQLGTFHGHQGELWIVDANPVITLLASGGADNTMRLWDPKTGQLLYTWHFPTAIKCVEFSLNRSQLLCVMEQRSGHLGAVSVFDVNKREPTQQSEQPRLRIVSSESKFTVAGISYASKSIIACHEDGSISQYDAASGELVDSIQAHDQRISDLQWAPDRAYFITASLDKTAKLISSLDLAELKTYVADTPLNSAAITPVKDSVLVGGGQAAMEVTTTSARQGKFEARFYHKVFAEEVGRVGGHFGPLNCKQPMHPYIHPHWARYDTDLLTYCYRCCCTSPGYVILQRRRGRLRTTAPLRSLVS
jgi:translation initiation factor 3 subunit I